MAREGKQIRKVYTYDNIRVLCGALASGVKFQTLIHLLLEGISEPSGRLGGEDIDTRSHRSLVGDTAGHTALVLLASLGNSTSVEQETKLGSVALSLESTEKGLLSTKNLQS